MSSEERLAQLKSYYKSKEELTLVGLNGSQAIRIINFLKHAFEDQIDKTVIDATSLTMNKTEHIDYILDANLSVAEIKQSQIYGTVSAIRKVMEDSHRPSFLGEIGSLSRFIYRKEKEDKNIHITDAIKQSNEPIVIYSSGENNLMREVGNNPGRIVKDYKSKDKTPNYNYTKEKAQDKKTLQNVLVSVERNLNHILTLNQGTDIYVLGTYIPKNLEAEELKILKDLILTYNEKLKQLCEIYGCSYITTEKVGSDYLSSDRFFHPTKNGSQYIKENILEAMYERKIENKPFMSREVMYKPTYIYGKGPHYVMYAADDDFRKAVKEANRLEGYLKERKLQEAEEHRKEAEIFQKIVYKQRTKRF